LEFQKKIEHIAGEKGKIKRRGRQAHFIKRDEGKYTGARAIQKIHSKIKSMEIVYFNTGEGKHPKKKAASASPRRGTDVGKDEASYPDDYVGKNQFTTGGGILPRSCGGGKRG